MIQSATQDQTDWILIFISWLLATTGMLGSLFFSEVMEIAPCVLCWWQRIFMYPLVVILLLGLYPLDRKVVRYSLPLAVIGLGFSIYHYLLYSGYIPQELAPCGEGSSCTEITLELFGFVTIPMLAIIAYSTIIALLLTVRHRIQQ
ncbi:MAG: disulfide bond formation protein B [Sedimenticola sp.]